MIKHLITEIVRTIRKNKNFKAYFTIIIIFLLCFVLLVIRRSYFEGVKSLINHFKGAEIVSKGGIVC